MSHYNSVFDRFFVLLMLLTAPCAGKDEGNLSPIQAYYTCKCHQAGAQSPFVAILMCCHDKILRNNGNIYMLMHSNKVHIKSCCNEG